MPTKGTRHGRTFAQMQRLAEARSRSVSTNPSLSEAGSRSSSVNPGPSMTSESYIEDEENVIAELVQKLQKADSMLEVEQQKSAELLQALSFEKQHSETLLETLKIEREHVKSLSAQFQEERKYSQNLYKLLRVERRARQRGNQRKAVLKEQIKTLKSANVVTYDGLQQMTKSASAAVDNLLKIRKENTYLQVELSAALNRATTNAEEFKHKLENATAKLKASRVHMQRLQRQCRNAASHTERAIEKAKTQTRFHSLLHKGVYTEESRSLMRYLVQVGCAREHVGKVIRTVLASAGITVKGNPSRRTVTRAGSEGLLYSQIQLGYEMDDLTSMTLSGDGTTHRGIQYYARHANYAIQSQAPDGSTTKEYVTRFLGVHSALDGTSEQSIKAWKETLAKVAEIYNKSPLQERRGNLLRVVDMLAKLTGMNTDHCAKEKKDARLMEKEKMKAVHQTLGEDAILEKSNEEILPYLIRARAKMIEATGGNEKWKSLSASEQADHEAVMMEKLLEELGKDSFEKLSSEERGILKLFIWTGCGCHKDLNSVKGGNEAMMDWWKHNEIPGPVLLANRDNKTILENVDTDAELTAVQERALKMTACGGVKAAKLAGDILNNKDDKKGYHDDFRWWWSIHVQGDFTFPDTSNTRFGCYCDAAIEMILQLPHFIEFMEYIKAKKINHRFSNMEENLWKALHCNATITELTVLALYAQAISHPYMQHIRSKKKLNMLDLGPLHRKVYRHMKKLIRKPELLIGPNAKGETGAFDGKEWKRKEVFDTVQKLISELPYLKDLLIAFFKGAAKTWKRFISEFAPGGLIDEATIEEREAAWMPPTNDVNEGALGAYRVAMRRQPWLSEDQFNAWYMARVNKTEEFVKAVLTHPEDHKFVHKLAREGELQDKQMRKKALVEYNEARIQKRMKALEKKKIRAEKIGLVELISDKNKVSNLKGGALNLQIQAFKQAGAPNLQGGVSALKADQKRQALIEAVESLNAGMWKDSRQSNNTDEGDADDGDTDDGDADKGDADEGDADEGDADESNEDEDESNKDGTDEDSAWEDEDE